MQYNRNELVIDRGSFRMKGDTLEVQPAYSNEAIRVSFYADENILIGIDATGPVEEITSRALAALRPFVR